MNHGFRQQTSVVSATELSQRACWEAAEGRFSTGGERQRRSHSLYAVRKSRRFSEGRKESSTRTQTFPVEIVAKLVAQCVRGHGSLREVGALNTHIIVENRRLPKERITE